MSVRAVLGVAASLLVSLGAMAAPSNPIVFVTQVPQPDDFANMVSAFANHEATMYSAPRGGDLYIRYVDGTLKNITAAAGFGKAGFQNENGIAVRDPAVHWDGTKVIFSMVIGAPEQYDWNDYRWQLYEATGLGKEETPTITKVPNQPSSYNNVMPVYAPDDKIIFVTDRPRNGATHLYPQLDEYESTPTNTGLWKLDPTDGILTILDHSPSGDFHPIIDSFGRVLFTRWDHLQRDQQADGTDEYGAFNYSSEASNATDLDNKVEVFPEPRTLGEDETLNHHSFNHFFPWEVNVDGSALVTLNHIGRHELHDYFQQTFNNDPNLEEFIDEDTDRTNEDYIINFYNVREDPNTPGLYYGVDAPEFHTHTAGQIVTLTGAPSVSADDMFVSYITHRDTAEYTNNPSSKHSGLYRNPLPMTNGELVAVHTAETRKDKNDGTRADPSTRYDFRLKLATKTGKYYTASTPLTDGISKSVSFYDPDVLVSWSGNLWELQPVELVARTRPTPRTEELPTPEANLFNLEGVDLTEFKNYLKERNLALIVSRNVTTRDDLDRQQPFNLKVAGSETKTRAEAGKMYTVSDLQLFQGDQIRAYTEFDEGRRVIPQTLHDPRIPEFSKTGSFDGSVKIEMDGSLAALVPAERAVTWQLTDEAGAGVVRERYWLTFKPGEIRICASCHGINKTDQVGATPPENAPEALRQLLRSYKNAPPEEDPTFDVELALMGRATSSKRIRLQSKHRAEIAVDGTNSTAYYKYLSLETSVNGKRCATKPRTFQTSEVGDYSLTGMLPMVRGRHKIQLNLLYQDEVVATTTKKLMGRRVRVGSRGRAKQRAYRKLCRKIASFAP